MNSVPNSNIGLHSPSTLNDLKRQHNNLQHMARAQYAVVQDTCTEIEALRKRIEKIEGEDWDPVPLIFGGDLHIYADGENIAVQ